MDRRHEGLLLCLMAAAGFSTTGVLAKLAYAAHVHLTTLLFWRFALAAFYAGISRVGPSTASILMTVEPALTVILAAVVLQERLGLPQIAGGAMVMAAVLLLQFRQADDSASALAR